MGNGSIENSSTGGVNVGKIMHGGFNDDVPIISEEPFIDVPTTNTPETLVEIEAKVNDDIEMLDGAELIQPEIKNIRQLKHIIDEYTAGKDISIKVVMLKEFSKDLEYIIDKYKTNNCIISKEEN